MFRKQFIVLITRPPADDIVVEIVIVRLKRAARPGALGRAATGVQAGELLD